MKKMTVLFLSLALVMVFAPRARTAMLFELDFGQDGTFENYWEMQTNDVVLVDIYASNVPSPGLISIGMDLVYDPVQLQVTQATEVDMTHWELAPQMTFGAGEVEMKRGRLLPGLKDDRIKLGTLALKCMNPGLSKLWMYDSDRQGGYDDFVLSDGTVLDGELGGGILVATVNSPFKMQLDAGWSMVSLPVVPESLKLSDVFPGAGVVYGYEKNVGYGRVQENHALEVGKGYWIFLNEARTYTLTGEPIQEYTCPVQDGWYMIGGCSSSARASVTNSNIEVIYGYVPGSGYQRLQAPYHLEPGGGYWILFSHITDQAALKVTSE
ncbi:MAG: hypothetical protein ACFFCW_28965 [Candidatus Hodarchaeota archaeon]